MKKIKTSMQLTPEVKGQIEKLASFHGISQADVIEGAVREKYKIDIDQSNKLHLDKLIARLENVVMMLLEKEGVK